MKYLWIAFLFSVAAFGQAQSSAPSQTNSIEQANIDKAQSVLNQAITALGGQAYLNIQEITTQGRTYSLYHGRPTGGGIDFWRFFKYPDKDRIELTKDRDWIEMFIGDKGYEITYRGVQEQKAKDVTAYIRRRKFSLASILREWIHAPGVALFYDGQSLANDTPADKVTVLNAQNQGVTLYFDSNTHLPVKESYSWRDPVDQERDTEDEIYGNYRPIQGIMTPYTVTRYYNGEMAGQIFLNSAAYNQDISDSQFDPSTARPPKKK